MTIQVKVNEPERLMTQPPHVHYVPPDFTKGTLAKARSQLEGLYGPDAQKRAILGVAAQETLRAFWSQHVAGVPPQALPAVELDAAWTEAYVELARLLDAKRSAPLDVIAIDAPSKSKLAHLSVAICNVTECVEALVKLNPEIERVKEETETVSVSAAKAESRRDDACGVTADKPTAESPAPAPPRTRPRSNCIVVAPTPLAALRRWRHSLRSTHARPLPAPPSQPRSAGTALALDGRRTRRLTLSDVGFVGFNCFAFTAQRTGARHIFFHRFANSMRHEPSGFIGDA